MWLKRICLDKEMPFLCNVLWATLFNNWWGELLPFLPVLSCTFSSFWVHCSYKCLQTYQRIDVSNHTRSQKTLLNRRYAHLVQFVCIGSYNIILIIMFITTINQFSKSKKLHSSKRYYCWSVALVREPLMFSRNVDTLKLQLNIIEDMQSKMITADRWTRNSKFWSIEHFALVEPCIIYDNGWYRRSKFYFEVLFPFQQFRNSECLKSIEYHRFVNIVNQCTFIYVLLGGRWK